MISSSSLWYWDSWYFKEGDSYYAFHLQAPKSLGDPNLRHINASIGLSRSQDLQKWEVATEVIGSSESGFDSQATWTGSVVKDPTTGTFHLFYTGMEIINEKFVQTVGHATSQDLMKFTRTSTTPILRADARWYGTQEESERNDEAFRDPWVFFYDRDHMWHMLVTAQLRGKHPMNQGTIAHATSRDLYLWEHQGPLVHDVNIFQLEVPQIVELYGKYFLIFCVDIKHITNPKPHFKTGTYCVPADSPTGPFDFSRMELMSTLYAGRVLFDFQNKPVLMGFVDLGVDGEFGGYIDGPISLRLTDAGTLLPA